MTVELVKKLKGYAPETYTRGENDYLRMLERNDLDGVIVATDVYRCRTYCVHESRQARRDQRVSHHRGATVVENTNAVGVCMLLENCRYGDVTVVVC
jgi:hypothetical protein